MNAIYHAIFQDVTGVILAGGKAERFGRNKAFARFQEMSLLQRILRVMQAVFSEVVLVTNTPEEYHTSPIRILVDKQPYQGPMGGIATALEYSPHPHCFVVACDMPLLNPVIIREIVEQGRGFHACIPTHDGQSEYLMALYSKELLDRMNQFLKESRVSLKEFFREASSVIWFPIEGDSSFNVNTPQDLKILERRYAL